MRFPCFATTITGLEGYAASECRELAGVEAKPDVGKIIFEADDEAIIRLNLSSRMLHRIFLMLGRIHVDGIEDIYRFMKGLDYTDLIGPDQSFAVRAERHSKHYPFTSLDIAATAGKAIIESYLGSVGRRLKVDLDNPDIEFYCLLRDSEFFIGLNTTGKSLHHRYYRVYHHRAALHPTIAVGMLRISGWRERDSLLDPMCGGGTIPIEAALLGLRVPIGLRRNRLKVWELRFFRHEVIEKVSRDLERKIRRNIKLKISGSDASPKSIEGAKMNAERAGVSGIVDFSVKDIFKIGEWISEEPDHVVFNPPYGIRMGIRNIGVFYEEICRRLAEASPHSTLTAIVSKPTLFSKSLLKTGYRIKNRVEVMYGRLRAAVISAER